MKALKIIFVLLCVALLINFVRSGAAFPLPQVLPGCDGKALDPVYFAGGVALIVLVLWGLRRLSCRDDGADRWR